MEVLIRIIVNWVPMLIVAAALMLFLRKAKSSQNETISYLKKQNDLIEKHIKVMERIAVSLEKTGSGRIDPCDGCPGKPLKTLQADD